MTQERYAKEILPVVRRRKEECEAVGLKFVFQEDNDGSHGTRSFENSARYAKDEMELEYFDPWSPHSPDLNPIETAWRILKSRVKLHFSTSAQQLREAIEYEWDRITLVEINEAILGAKGSKKDSRGVKGGKNCSMKNRMEQCYERHGYATEF